MSRSQNSTLFSRFKTVIGIEGGFIRRNIVSLYVLYFATYASSILTLPYLARTLGPSSFGSLAATQAYAWCIQMIVEYGFNFSGARAAQKIRSDKFALADLIANIHGAKSGLFALCFAVTLLLAPYIPAFHANSQLLVYGLIFGCAQGFTPIWIFQGIDRMKQFTVLDSSIRMVSTTFIFLLVKSPHDNGLAMGVQAIGACVTTMIGLTIIWWRVPLRVPSRQGILERLREGGNLFIYRLTYNVQMYANPLLLSFFAAPRFVAFYSGPERIAKFALGVIGPFSEGIYPYLGRKFDESQDSGRKLALYTVGATVLLTAGLSIVMFLLSPWLVRLALGDGFGDAVSVARILSFLPLVAGLVNSLGVQWMIPMGMGRKYNIITLCSFALHLCLSAILCSRWQHLGMASSVVLSQSVAALAMLYFVRHGINLKKAAKTPLRVQDQPLPVNVEEAVESAQL